MNKYKFLIITLALGLLGCDSSIDPNGFFDENANGAWLRTVSINPNLNLTNIETATFEITLEENDEQNGALLDKVNVYASFKDNTVSGEDISVSETLYTTLMASEFDTSSGKPVITQIITANEISDFLNLDTNDFAPTDLFVFRYELVLTDGRIFSVANAGINVSDSTKPFYNSPFTYNAPLVCPVPSSFAVGQYQIETTIPGQFGPNFDGVITLSIGGSPTKRTFTGDWNGFGVQRPYQFDLICGEIIFDDQQSTGLGCAALIIHGTANSNTNYEENDDTFLLVNMTENLLGACGGTPTQAQFSLTRI